MGYYKRYIQKGIAILLMTICIINSTVNAVENEQNIEKAQTLFVLGLFKGTNNGFELTKSSTRAEAAVMLVRLLGEESEALTGDYEMHPFSDVPKWVEPYISYLYNKGLTNGVSSELYGSQQQITASQYTTMMLRALGYSDQDGVYQWDTSLEFANTIGLLSQEELIAFQQVAHKSILRDDMVKLSYNGLFTNIKDSEIKLLERLVTTDVISKAYLIEAIKIDEAVKKLFENTDVDIITVPDEAIDPGSISGEMKGVWITYLELQKLFANNKTEDSFRAAIASTYNNVSDLGLNTVFVQVRPFADAIYQSSYYPWSYIITGTEGGNPGYDPLQVLVEEAHKQNLKIEAWINPFRVRLSGSKVILSADNQANVWLNDGSNRVLQISEGIIYNPASQEARDLITNGVVEIVTNYDIDGIHFDDYFYPSTSLTYDSLDYNTYKSNGGNLTQQAWRRENVNLLVQQVYSAIKNIDTTVQFGISPQGSMEANFNQQFIDVEKWVSNSGYIDYICPQIYYGYNHSKYPYKSVVEQWDNMIKSDSVKLYAGIAAYKIGREDKWAGSGIREWIDSKYLLKSMILDARTTSHYGGFILYRYNYINANDTEGVFVDKMIEELEALKGILK